MDFAPHQLDDFAATFRREGVARVRGLFDATAVQAIRDDVDRILGSSIVGRWNARFRYWRNSGDQPERIEPIVDLSGAARGAVRQRQLVRLLTEVLGDFPCLLKDKVVLAPAGGSGYELHQDYVFYPYGNPNQMVAVAVALDASSAENGVLQMYPRQMSRSYTHWQPRALSPEEAALVRAEGAALALNQAPGDAVFFHSLTPHESGPNRSPRCRRMLHLTFTAGSLGDCYARQRQDYRRQMPELGSGFA